jgi:hypothetical protein
MRAVSKWFAVSTLVACSGCSGAISDARRDHILAVDHGWVDLVLKAPAQADGIKPGANCLISLSLNGEPMLNESANLAQAEASQNLVGYRLVAPAGKLEAELIISMCVKNPLVAKLALPLEKDHLASLQFDGKALVDQGSSEYAPTSLEWVRGEILKLQAGGLSSSEALATLIKLGIVSLGLNVATLLYVFWKRRRV